MAVDTAPAYPSGAEHRGAWFRGRAPFSLLARQPFLITASLHRSACIMPQIGHPKGPTIPLWGALDDSSLSYGAALGGQRRDGCASLFFMRSSIRRGTVPTAFGD